MLAKMAEMRQNGTLEVDESVLLTFSKYKGPQSRPFAAALRELKERNYITKKGFARDKNAKYMLTKNGLIFLMESRATKAVLL